VNVTEKLVYEREIVFARANITYIDAAGLMTITMSEPVIVPPSWQEEELPIEIFDVWFVKYAEEENQLYGFNLTKFEATEIQIQLNFSHPLAVSTGDLVDEIVVRMEKLFFLLPSGVTS